MSGESIIFTFPEGVSVAEYFEECCDCGAVHKVIMSIDKESRTITVQWFTVRRGTKNQRGRPARECRLARLSKGRVITSGMYRVNP